MFLGIYNFEVTSNSLNSPFSKSSVSINLDSIKRDSYFFSKQKNLTVSSKSDFSATCSTVSTGDKNNILSDTHLLVFFGADKKSSPAK